MKTKIEFDSKTKELNPDGNITKINQLKVIK